MQKLHFCIILTPGGVLGGSGGAEPPGKARLRKLGASDGVEVHIGAIFNFGSFLPPGGVLGGPGRRSPPRKTMSKKSKNQKIRFFAQGV